MIGVYLSGTGNTKHCVEGLVRLLDAAAECIPLEAPHITETLEKQSTIILGYRKTSGYTDKLKICDACIGCGLCSRNCPMGNIEIKDHRAIPGKQCTMCYRCISLCPQKAINLLGERVQEQCRYEKYV